MNIRLIFSDVDGTLINSKGELSENTKKVVHKVNELNIPFVLVSFYIIVSLHLFTTA